MLEIYSLTNSKSYAKLKDRMKRILLIGLFLLLLVPNLQGSASEAGAIFLIIYPGARPNGMGTVFTAISDDAYATYYNDAGLGFQEENYVGLMHANWLSGLYPDMYYEFIGLVHPLAGGGVIGGHIIYLTTGETIGTTIEGTEIARWRTFDAAVKISYGTKLNERLAIGLGAKFIYSFLVPAWVVEKILGMDYKGGGTGTAWGFDVSTLYILNRYIQMGASLQNIGPNIKYTDTGESDPIPWTLRLGIAWHPIRSKANKLTISLELTKILVGIFSDLREVQKDFKEGLSYIYQDTWKGIGAEYIWSDLLCLRAGYFWDTIGSRVGPTFGGGIMFRGLRLDIGVDSPLYDFPTDNYRFSLSYTF